jgi:malic enzyme
MSDIKTALTQYNNAMDALEAAETAVQDALMCVKNAAGSATIDVAGQFFQVRKRKDKFYLCELTGKPRGRPKGSKNTKPKKGSVPPLEAVDTMNVVDVFSTDVLLDQADAVPEAVAEEVYEEIPETTGVRTVVETLDSASA